MSKTWFYVALGAAGLWLYFNAKEKGGNLKGSIGPFRVDAGTLVNAAMPLVGIRNPIVRTIISEGAKGFFNGIIGEDHSDAIDVEYRRLA